MSSHTAARYCRVICGWGSAATSTHENENPAASNFAQGLDMPRETDNPAAACSSIAENVPRRLPSGWPSARHACLAPVTPSAYRRIVPCSRTAWCSACAPVQRMRAWSLPALLFLSEPVCRSVGRRPEARAHGGKATRPHPLWHPSRRISLGSRRNSARCARTAPDSPFRVVSACDSLPTN